MAKKVKEAPARLAAYAPATVWARRTVAEELRDLVSVQDIGFALLSVFKGVDPFTRQRNQDRQRAALLAPDNMPIDIEPENPIPWQHRIAAARLFLSYAHGRPLAGLDVRSDIDQRTAIEGQQTQSIDVSKLDADARRVLRQALAGAVAAGAVVGAGAKDPK